MENPDIGRKETCASIGGKSQICIGGGDGCVYILDEGDGARYLDGADYETWREVSLEGAKEIAVSFLPLTENEIERLRAGTDMAPSADADMKGAPD